MKTVPPLLLGVLFYLIPLTKVYCQKDTTINIVGNMVTFYTNNLKTESPVFNGKAYNPYPFPIINKGHSYYLINDLSLGNIKYEGRDYSNLNIMYDIVKDELILLHLNNYSKLVVKKEKTDQFTLHEHTFINIKKDSVHTGLKEFGYFDLLYKGKISLLVKRKKTITEKMFLSTLERNIDEYNYYYILKNSKYTAVNNKKELLKLLKQNGNLNKQFIKANKLNFIREKENAILSMVKFYDSSNK